MSPNVFAEEHHTIGSKIPPGIVCLILLQSAGAHSDPPAINHSNFVYFGGVGDFYWYLFDKRTGNQLCLNQVLKLGTNVGY